MERISLDRLTGLVAFARAASLGSYTAAARALDVSPSAVSKSVQRLEERLGLRLFHRTTRSLTLTSEGRELHERAVRLLREAEEIEQTALATRSEPSGALKIAAPTTIAAHVLAPALPRLRKRHPKLAIDLRADDRYIDLVEQGIDIAIRVGEPTDSRLISRHLGPHRICVFASPRYLARHGTPRRPEDLFDHTCVGYRYQSSGHELRWPFQTKDRIEELSPSTDVVMDSSEAVATFLAAGGGIGISPTHVAATFVRRGELVPVLAEHAVVRAPMTALWPESRRKSPNVKAFVTFLKELFASPTPWDLAVAEAAGLDATWTVAQKKA